jgi:hypothetical protein
MHTLGREVLHASGLVISGVPVALCGDVKAGKSTLAYAWQRRGGEVYSDDAIPVRIEGDRVVIDPIAYCIKLRRPSQTYFGSLAQNGSGLVDEDLFRMARGAAHLGSIYLLNRRGDGGGPIEIERVSPSAALTAMLHFGLCFGEPGRERLWQTVQTCIDLIRLVPVHRFSVPTDLDRLNEILGALSDHVARLSCDSVNRGGS